jgi:hypothetical protein
MDIGIFWGEGMAVDAMCFSTIPGDESTLAHGIMDIFSRGSEEQVCGIYAWWMAAM